MLFSLPDNRMELVWHAHHRTESPLEVIPSFEGRLEMISEKAKHEEAWQTKVRLKLFKRFVGKLPHPLDKLYEEWGKIYELANLAREDGNYIKMLAVGKEYMLAYNSFYRELNYRTYSISVLQEYMLAYNNFYWELNYRTYSISVLHAQQCGCAWSALEPDIFLYSRPKPILIESKVEEGVEV